MVGCYLKAKTKQKLDCDVLVHEGDMVTNG